MSEKTVDDLFQFGLVFAALVGLAFFFLILDFSSPVENTDSVTRFIFAMVSIIAPTSMLDVSISVGVALIGGITVGRENVAAGILTVAILYGIVSFAIGWVTALV